MTHFLVIAGTSTCFAAVLIIAFLALGDDDSQQFSGSTDRTRRNLRGLRCYSFTGCGEPQPSSNFEPIRNVFGVGTNTRPGGRAPGPSDVEGDPTQRFGIDRTDPFNADNFEPAVDRFSPIGGSAGFIPGPSEVEGDPTERFGIDRTDPFPADNYDPAVDRFSPIGSSGAGGFIPGPSDVEGDPTKRFGIDRTDPFPNTNYYEPSSLTAGRNGRYSFGPAAPSPVGRAPSEAAQETKTAQEMKRVLLLHMKNVRKFRRRVADRDYTFEYSMEEYNLNIGRNGRRDIRPFANLDYTAVSVKDGIVSPRGRRSAVFLFSEIDEMIRDGIKRPEQLGTCSFKYSRRYGLPRYIYCEHDGKVLKISARNLNTVASPTV